jgi:serine O-acetyltransferase
MIIKTKKELRFCLMADRMMNRGSFRITWLQRLKELVRPDLPMKYLRCMRKLSYYKYRRNPIWIYYHGKYIKLGYRLGYTVCPDSCGYGLVFPHYGVIVIGRKNTIGNYAMIHVGTLFTTDERIVGDNLYLASGAKVTTGMNLGNSVTIAANSVVTKSFVDDNILLAGMPAVIKGKRGPWWEANETFIMRHQRCEELRAKMFFSH